MESYERDGYVIFRNVLDAELLSEALQHLEWLLKNNPTVRPEDLQSPIVGADPFWLRLMSDDRLLDIAQMFIGPDIALFGGHYFCKPPFDGKAVLWHQDGSYWPLDPMDVVTLWLAVSDVDMENGCLRVIAGSHQLGLQEMQESTEVANVLNSQIDPAMVDESKVVNCELQAGEVEVHHPNIIHGSNANLSSRRRDGLAIRYISTRTRITTDYTWPAYLLRGDAVPGINEYMPRPIFDPEKHIAFRGCEEWK